MTTKTILVIDDSGTIPAQVKAALVPHGYQIVEAVDGAEGKEKILETKGLSMILCDVNMPHLNGIDMLNELRQERFELSAAVLMMTTEGNANMIKRGQDLGVRAWIVKPFRLDQLIATVNRMTESRA